MVSRNGGKTVPGALMSKSPIWAFGARSHFELWETTEDMFPSCPPVGWKAGYLPTLPSTNQLCADFPACSTKPVSMATESPPAHGHRDLQQEATGKPMNGGCKLTLVGPNTVC